MLDWKILAASFVALIFISSFLVGNFGIKELVGKIIDKVDDWLSGSPFEGFFKAPSKEDTQTERIELVIYPENFSIKPDSVVDIKIGDIQLNKFSGEINADFRKNKISLNQKDSEFKIEMPVQRTLISNLELKTLSVNGKIYMKTGKWEFNTENGSVQLFGFSGNMEINIDSIGFTGNATRVLRE